MLNRILLVVLLTITSAFIATAQTAALKNYYNQENKVGFKYPAKWASGKHKWELKTESAPISEEPGFTVQMELSNPDLSIRSYVSSASVSLAVGTVDQATCKAMKIGNLNTEDKPVTKKVGTRSFSYLEDGDVATGMAGTTDYYRTFHDGKCYELQFEKVGSNTPKRPDRNEKALNQQFNAILRSLYFGK